MKQSESIGIDKYRFGILEIIRIEIIFLEMFYNAIQLQNALLPFSVKDT